MEAIEQELSPCEAFERKLVHHCTPTLAALKPANLFTCRSTLSPTAVQHGRRPTAAALRDDQLSDALRACRAKLAPHGVRIEVLAAARAGRSCTCTGPGCSRAPSSRSRWPRS